VYPKASPGTDLSGPFGPQSTAPHSWRLSQVTDGLSNTLMLSEMSGRPWLHVAGNRQVFSSSFPSYVTASMEDVTDNIPLDYGWGAWAHNNNFNVGTWSSDGTLQGGFCVVNRSNYRGVYSFHTAGAHSAFADGSVHLLPPQLSPAIFFALVTARAGEVASLTAVLR
jgi:hypothetical protein